MSASLTINKSSFSNFGKSRGARKAASSNCTVLNMRKNSQGGARRGMARQDANAGIKKAFFIAALTLFFSGTFYLYQVNDLASKAYEVKEVENRIARLKQINDKNIIQEVELRSMYNIEKATGKFKLKNVSNISYLEIDGPVAMK